MPEHFLLKKTDRPQENLLPGPKPVGVLSELSWPYGRKITLAPSTYLVPSKGLGRDRNTDWEMCIWQSQPRAQAHKNWDLLTGLQNISHAPDPPITTLLKACLHEFHFPNTSCTAFNQNPQGILKSKKPHLKKENEHQNQTQTWRGCLSYQTGNFKKLWLIC